MRRNPLRRSLPSFPSLPSPLGANQGRSRMGRTGGEESPRPENESATRYERRLVWPQTTSSLLDPLSYGASAAKRKEAKSVPESRPYRIRDALDESAPTKPKARPELKKPRESR